MVESTLSPATLFSKYINALTRQCKRDKQIVKLNPNLGLRNWNLHFLAHEGIKNYNFDVWCNKLSQFKSEFGDRLEPHEFLWDLCWFQREKKVVKGESDFCALVLEQEFNDAIGSVEAWMDFTKILFAEVTLIRVFIGKSSQKGFETIPNEWAKYYSQNGCTKDAGLLLILVNQAGKDLTIRGWEFKKNGKAMDLGAGHFTYSRYV